MKALKVRFKKDCSSPTAHLYIHVSVEWERCLWPRSHMSVLNLLVVESYHLRVVPKITSVFDMDHN